MSKLNKLIKSKSLFELWLMSIATALSAYGLMSLVHSYKNNNMAIYIVPAFLVILLPALILKKRNDAVSGKVKSEQTLSSLAIKNSDENE